MSITADVSIVHAGADTRVAARIASALRRRGIDVWMDLENVIRQFTPVDSLDHIITSCRVLIPILSQSWHKVEWVRYETPRMVNLTEIHKRLVVLPVLVDCSEIPLFLRDRLCLRVTDDDFESEMDTLASAISARLDRRTVFICHSSRDKNVVTRIVEAIKQHEHVTVWYDDADLKPGAVIRRGIESGIANADYLIVVVSRSAIDTIQGWIGFELDQAYEVERSRNQSGHYFAIPAIIDENVDVPGWLSTKVHVDLTKDFDGGIKRLVEAVSVPVPKVQNLPGGKNA